MGLQLQHGQGLVTELDELTVEQGIACGRPHGDQGLGHLSGRASFAIVENERLSIHRGQSSQRGPDRGFSTPRVQQLLGTRRWVGRLLGRCHDPQSNLANLVRQVPGDTRKPTP